MTLNQNKVDEIIARFEQSPDLNLAELLEDSRVLSCQLYHYSKLLGDVGREYRMLHVRRKIKRTEIADAVRSEVGSDAAAYRKAENHPKYKELYREEYAAEGRYQKGKLMHTAIVNVLSRMQQEIAELRQEKSTISRTQPV